jgi:hypothetical protein
MSKKYTAEEKKLMAQLKELREREQEQERERLAEKRVRIKSDLKPTKSARFHRGSNEDAQEAAVRMSAGHGGREIFIHATYYGIQLRWDHNFLGRGIKVSATYNDGYYDIITQGVGS